MTDTGQAFFGERLMCIPGRREVLSSSSLIVCPSQKPEANSPRLMPKLNMKSPKHLLALLVGLLMLSGKLLADDGSDNVTLTNPDPNPVCAGSPVNIIATSSVVAPSDTADELAIFSTNYIWAAVDDAGTNVPGTGSGASCLFTWDSYGCGTRTIMVTNTVTFIGTNNQGYYTNTGTGTTNATVDVEAVTSLTPSAGLWVDDGDGDPNTATYLVQYGCNSSIIVTAADCLGLDASSLPACWLPTVTTTGSATKLDNKTFSVDGYTVGKTVINVSCGNSYKTVTIIVYQAIYTINADGNISIDPNTFGHAWWNLSAQPSDVYQYLKKSDGTDLSQDADNGGPLCSGGYYGTGNAITYITGCVGEVLYGAQPIIGTSPLKYHSVTDSYWWCISFEHLIGALTYAYDLNLAPGTFYLHSNNCVTEAMEVGTEAGVSVGYTGYMPVELNAYLDNMINQNGVPYCYCQ